MNKAKQAFRTVDFSIPENRVNGWYDITPALAMWMLGYNTFNRPLDVNYVARIARVMQAGAQRVTPDPVSFTRTMRLLEGQHRLHAIVKSGVTIEMYVIWDAPEEAFDVLGQGKPRSLSMVLRMEGIPNANESAAAARLLILYFRAAQYVWTGTHPNVAVSPTEQGDYVRQRQDAFAEAATLGASCRSAFKPINATVMTALTMLVLWDSRHADRYMDFIEGVRTGAMLTPTDPRLALRNYFIRSKGNGGWHRQAALGAAIKAWNAYVEDRPISVLRFSQAELPMPGIK